MIPFLTLVLATKPAPVTIVSLLDEMTDLRRLTQRPDPRYRYRQWTSYDRKSDAGKDPFANDDFGQFLRDETHEGRTDRVMADVKGPGALVRLWSANPVGTFRFYFDGETKPRLESDARGILSGKNPAFPDPFSYVAAQGANLYYPMPFAKGLKVTWDGNGKVPNSGLYYAVGIREYAPGTSIETFTMEGAARARKDAERVGKALVAGDPVRVARGPVAVGPTPPGESLGLNAELVQGKPEGGEIDEIRVDLRDAVDPVDKPWSDSHRLHNVVRRLRLKASFDGETTVDVPLGDFFGSAVGVNPFESLPLSVRKGGEMIARWSMPFRRKARVWIENGNDFPVDLSLKIRTADRPFIPGTYLFHARWHAQTKPTRPMYEFNFADVKGEGRFVGVGLQITNPALVWWGEGDEKVYVDGEGFPSLFGTGTEDYFGYAWGDPAPFSRPYHAQPPTPNKGSQGQTQNSRYHIVDDIPFKTGIKFDMEAWHWADVPATYATTAYWYALPGTTLPDAPDPATLLIPDAPVPQPVAGAIEGEDLKWKVTGGRAETQDGFAELSGAKQFWWREPGVGATAETTFDVPVAGRYELVANLGHARDYGHFAVVVNGKAGNEIDLYRDGLEWRWESLGIFDLPAGKASVRFVVLPTNPKGEPGKNMLGVDYFLLAKP